MLFLENFVLKRKERFFTVVFTDKMGKTLTFKQATAKVWTRLYNYCLDLELLLARVVGLVPIHTVRWAFYRLIGLNASWTSHIHMGAQFFYPGGIKIGEGTIIGQNVFLDGRDRLIIGKFVDIASDVMIYNSEHDTSSDDFRAVTAPVEIGDYCFIGPRAIILPGVKIGKGAVVAAGAVVVSDVLDFEIVGGVPAKVVGHRKLTDPHYRLGRARLFQ